MNSFNHYHSRCGGEAPFANSLYLRYFDVVRKFVVQVHPVITVDTVDVCYALLELAPRLYSILHRHIAHSVSPLLDVLGTVTFFN